MILNLNTKVEVDKAQYASRIGNNGAVQRDMFQDYAQEINILYFYLSRLLLIIMCIYHKT